MGHAELDETRLTKLHIDLLKTKGGTEQQEFLNAVKDCEEFVSYIESRVGSTDGETVSLFSAPLTEQSFKEVPQDSEREVFDLWKDIPPRIACRTPFWGKVTLEHIRSGIIGEPSWLAMNGGTSETGEERIDMALANDGDNRQKRIDDCVRTVFRRMSGLPSVRGRRDVFVNPSFGRAWWRERMVTRVTNRPYSEGRDAILEVVRMNRQYWENLVTMIVSRGSVFGSTVVQDSFINTLAKRIKEDKNSTLRNASTLMKAMHRFSSVAASREVGVLDFDEIGHIVDAVLVQMDNS